MVKARNTKSTPNPDRRATPKGPTAAQAVPDEERAEPGLMEKSPLKLMALVWGIPIAIILVSLLLRSSFFR
jgi:hypothetical protein